MSTYYESIQKSKDILSRLVEQIFQQSDNKLKLLLQNQNLLENPNNCIESSTAIGYIIEEYVSSLLETSTDANNIPIKIERLSRATTQDSYDCYYNYGGIKYLVNIKAEKKGSANNAVAAIKQLYKDYCNTDEDTKKSYIVLKIKYSISYTEERFSKPERVIQINGVEPYCLEELDFSTSKGGFRQDNRNWSPGGNNFNNGRLQVSKKFRIEHMLDATKVSYEHTKQLITDIFNYNTHRQE